MPMWESGVGLWMVWMGGASEPIASMGHRYGAGRRAIGNGESMAGVAEAAKLFWQRPALCLPVLVASLVPLAVSSMSEWLRHWRLSTLSHIDIGYQSAWQWQLHVAKTTWPLVIGACLIYAAFSVSTFFVTAGAVRRLKSEESTALLRHGMMFLRLRWRAAMWLSFMGMGLLAIYEAAHLVVFNLSTTYLLDRLMRHDSAWELLRWRIEVLAFYTLLTCIGAWLLTGSAMRGIRLNGPQEIARADVRRGRRFAIAAVLISAAVDFVLTALRERVIPAGGLDGTVAEWELNAVHTMLVAFPYVLLFIALTRSVDEDSGTETST